MTKAKKILSIMLTVLMLCSVMIVETISVSATSRTADQAISWCQSNLGKGVEYSIDQWRYQCVDFIQAYYSYLGVTPSTGSGYQYATNTVPSGWTRTKGGAPQKGDILVYTGGYGHVAIHESNNISYHQNWNYPYVQKVSRAYNQSYTVTEDGVKVTKTYWGCIHPNFNGGTPIVSDTKAPTINNARAENISGSSFTVKCTLSDDVGVTRVWLVIYGPNGEKQYGKTASNGEFSHTIKTSDHGGEGNYTVHIYAFDAAEKSAKVIIGNIKVFNDSEKPKISNARAENISGNSFNINCTISDNIGVIRGWIVVYGPSGEKQYGISAANGEFSHTIKTSDHGGKGTYTVHLYVYDTIGNSDKVVISNIKALNDVDKPTITNARAESISGNSFDIKCTIADNIGVTRGWIVVYGPSGEKQYGISATNGEFSHTIKTSDHGGKGTYTVHLYVYDADGNSDKAVISNIKATDEIIETTETQSITNEPTEPSTINPTEVTTTESVEPTTIEPTNAHVTDNPRRPMVTEPTESNITSLKSNPIKVIVKNKTVKAKKIKKKAQNVKAITVKKAQGKVTYKLVKKGSTAKIFKFAKINSKGVITLSKWKKAKKGTYKLKVKITAAGNAKYNKKAVSKILKIKIR